MFFTLRVETKRCFPAILGSRWPPAVPARHVQEQDVSLVSLTQPLSDAEAGGLSLSYLHASGCNYFLLALKVRRLLREHRSLYNIVYYCLSLNLTVSQSVCVGSILSAIHCFLTYREMTPMYNGAEK